MAGPGNPPEEYRFKPGQSGNPNGWSRGRRLSDALIKHIEEKGLDDKLALVALKAALEGDFKFWQIVAHMVDGKPRETAEETRDADDGTKTLRDFLADFEPAADQPKKTTRPRRKQVRGEDR